MKKNPESGIKIGVGTSVGIKQPVLFIGHGSPLNAIEDNAFTKTLRSIGKSIPSPEAVLVISAHWLTNGTFVLGSSRPRTIYDFYGFPAELYEVSYPAVGAPEIAEEVQKQVTSVSIQWDESWGLDHGAWTILRHLFPKADIPVFQLSIDYNRPLKYHYNLARELQFLRNRNVLFIGSGNIVHNLRRVILSDKEAAVADWAVEFDLKIKQFLDERNHHNLLEYENIGTAARLAVPEPSHYIPLIYAIGLQERGDEIDYFYEKLEYGSLSMRSFIIQGAKHS